MIRPTDVAEGATERTDTERLDWLSKNFGLALLDDDNGHWAMSFSGSQNVPSGEEPEEIWASFDVKAGQWHPSVREAIDAAMGEGKKNKSKKIKREKVKAGEVRPLSCPFCGGKSIQSKIDRWRVSRFCFKCSAEGPRSEYGLSERSAKRQATERWNARTALIQEAIDGKIDIVEGESRQF